MLDKNFYGTFNYFILFHYWWYFWDSPSMNWLLNIFDSIKWKIEDAIWAIQDKIKLSKELKAIDAEWDITEEVGEIEAKPKKKKAKKKSAKKAKKSV